MPSAEQAAVNDANLERILWALQDAETSMNNLCLSYEGSTNVARISCLCEAKDQLRATIKTLSQCRNYPDKVQS
jgi:hypothetical protein